MPDQPPWIRRPGRLCLAASLLTMYAWCMLLPLVGRAGSRAPHARENFFTVLGVLVLALVFSLTGWLRSRRVEGEASPSKPFLGLALFQLILGLLLASGAFGI